MITLEIDSSNEGVEFYLNEEGVEDLIRYLNFIKLHKDHYHLVAGNELNEKLHNIDNILIKHVKLIYVDEIN